MTDLRKSAEMALEFVSWFASDDHSVRPKHKAPEIAEALRQALNDKPAVKSYAGGKPNYCTPEEILKTPLKVLNLTVFTENRLRNGRVYDVETLQAMTSRDILAIPDMGKKALKEVLEALDVHAVNISQDRVDETAKREHIIDCTDEQLMEEVRRRGFVIRDAQIDRDWVGLTDEEVAEYWRDAFAENTQYVQKFAKIIEAKLKEENT